MKASKVLENKVKQMITSNEGEVKLNHSVIIKSKSYTGYNFDTKEHEFVTSDYHIIEVLRQGKKGVVYVSDGINTWRPSELTETECESIMKELV